MNVHTQVSEVVEDNIDLENRISMLVRHKAKQRKKLHPNRIYQDNCFTYNHIYNENLLTDVIKRNSWIFENCNAGTTPTKHK